MIFMDCGYARKWNASHVTYSTLDARCLVSDNFPIRWVVIYLNWLALSVTRHTQKDTHKHNMYNHIMLITCYISHYCYRISHVEQLFIERSIGSDSRKYDNSNTGQIGLIFVQATSYIQNHSKAKTITNRNLRCFSSPRPPLSLLLSHSLLLWSVSPCASFVFVAEQAIF